MAKTIMITELTKLILSILIVGGIIFAVITAKTDAIQALVGLSGAIIGYYFRDVQQGLTGMIRGKQS